MEASQSSVVGQVLFRIAVDADAASHVRSGELLMLEGVLALALERVRTELACRDLNSSRKAHEVL